MDISALKIVGFEGLWGSAAMVGVLLPIVQRLPGKEGGGIHEDSIDTLHVRGAGVSAGRGAWTATIGGHCRPGRMGDDQELCMHASLKDVARVGHTLLVNSCGCVMCKNNISYPSHPFPADDLHQPHHRHHPAGGHGRAAHVQRGGHVRHRWAIDAKSHRV